MACEISKRPRVKAMPSIFSGDFWAASTKSPRKDGNARAVPDDKIKNTIPNANSA